MIVLKNTVCLISFIVICFVLASCSFLAEQSATPKPNIDPSLTSSPIPITPVSDITITPTIPTTPLPTLLPEESNELVMELLATNGNCKLPCWWGWIVPGKTKWEEVNKFLQTFAKEVRLGGEKDGILLYGAYFTVPELVRPKKELIVGIDVRGGIVEQIFIGQPFTLATLLQDYGEPTDIQLYISDSTFEDFLSEGKFSITLFWPDKGILAVYDGKIEKTELLNICMSELEPEPALWLWDPTNKRTMEEIGGELLYGGPPYKKEFYSLEKVLGISIETFYQTYLNLSNMNTCFTILGSFSP